MKLFAVVSNVTPTLNKALYRVLTVISVTISSLLAAVFYRLGAVVRYTFTADTRDRLTKLYKERVEVINLKERLQMVYKVRTELANKRQKKAEK
jgi:hypothetical protein